MFTRTEIYDILCKQLATYPDSVRTGIMEALDNSLKSAIVADEALPFGKYKGKTLTELYNDDKKKCVKYCKYLLTAKDKDQPDVCWVEEAFPELYDQAQLIVDNERLSRKRRREVMLSPAQPSAEELKNVYLP